MMLYKLSYKLRGYSNTKFYSAKMGSQVLVPFRGSEDCHRHLKIMGDLGQVKY